MGHRAGAAVILLFAFLVPGGPASAAVGEPATDLPPGLGIRLIDVPVDRAEDPRANSYIIDHVIPGAAVERTLRVTNGSDAPIPVEMVAETASLKDGWLVDGANAPGAITDWMTTDPSSFVLAPGSFFDVTATINVPGDTPPGERYAAFIAQPPPTGSGSVGLVSRVGVRVYLSVGGDEPETDFTIDTLTASRSADGTPHISVGILNTGGRAIDVGGELALRDPAASVSAGPFPVTIPRTLAPRSRDSVDVPLPESLGDGPWEVTATMRSGLTERVATTTVTFPSGDGQEAPPVAAETIGGTDSEGNDISEELRRQRRVLLPMALLLILLALMALWFFWSMSRRDKDDLETVDPVLDADEPAIATDGNGVDAAR